MAKGPLMAAGGRTDYLTATAIPAMMEATSSGATSRQRPASSGKVTAGVAGGRRKGTENHDTFFERELGRKIIVREDGQERKVTKGQA